MIHAINSIDVLRSFAMSAISSCGAMCRPKVLPHSIITNALMETTSPILYIKGIWHPYALGVNGATPVPNDIILGEDGGNCTAGSLLLTGPNMGGKSTLLRATCLAVILAQVCFVKTEVDTKHAVLSWLDYSCLITRIYVPQLGCYVPCETCTLSAVDIIFTRLGATDRIMTGESKFFHQTEFLFIDSKSGS